METASAIAPGPAATIARAMTTPATRTLRLSLVNQLVLLLVAAVLLAVSVLGGVVAWNLRAGFSDYLRVQDEDWLDRFAEVASAAVARQGLAAVAGPPGTLRPLFDAVGPRDEAAPRPPPEADDFRPPDRGPGRHGPPGAPPPGAQRIANRVSVVDLQGRSLAGRARPGAAIGSERTIVVDGRTVAYARLEPAALAPRDLDAAFLARQYRGILFTAGLLALLAVGGAVWAGRRWLRPLQEAQQAARRIAQGELGVRLTPRGNDELADLAHGINAMAASLQQLEASRRRWIAELSHEMRTPLAVLRGEVECLIDGVRPLNAAAMMSLQEEVARVTRLVEDFHHLALSDLRALPCNFEPMQPQALLRQAVERVAARAQAAGLTVTLAEAPSMPAAHGDPQRLGQLLANLLENSLRYTDAPGRVALSVTPAGAGQWALTVEDSAPGVPAADRHRLFEPLYRADPSRSRRSGGSGLGLSICRAIVRSHGGHIEADSSPLGGLRIVATLPLNPESGP